MQPLQYDLRCPAAKDTSITHSAAAPRNLDAAITMRSAETELRNTLELRATASKIAAPKPDLDAKAKKRRFWSTYKRNFKRAITSAKIEKMGWQMIIAALMHPLQFDAQLSAAKDKYYACSRGTQQPWRSHYTAICNHSFKKPIEQRTHEQPLLAEHREGTDYARNDPSRRTQEVLSSPPAATFTRKNTRIRAPASSPTSPMQHLCSHYNALCSIT